jgi:hypothetical protein
VGCSDTLRTARQTQGTRRFIGGSRADAPTDRLPLFPEHPEPVPRTPPSATRFARHVARQAGYAFVLVAVSLLIGMAGYHWVAGYRWIDAFLNASMLLGGMGPVGELRTDGAKLFAGTFALYSGLVFLAVTALGLTPVFHWVLHRFHWEWTQEGG